MRKRAMWLAVAFALAPAVCSAQVSIDMNRISCADLIAMPADDADMAAAWLSGWFNQKSNYTWIDLKAYHRNVASIHDYCAANPNDLVMNVIEKAVREQQPKH